MQETLLIVEDDAHTADLLKTIFEMEGYRAVIAGDGREALFKAAAEQPKLILLDLILPDMEGYEVIRRLKADAKTANLPVVILSSRRDFDDKLHGLQLGALEYLTKPFQRQELTFRVRNILHLCRSFAGELADEQERDQTLDLLEHMLDRHIGVLIPKTTREARLGFEYPEAAQIFRPAQIGEEIEELESMADREVLDRVFFDTIHLCPSCGHHDLNFREVCPYCETPEVQQTPLLVHLPCSAALEPGPLALCPKCDTLATDSSEEFVKASGYRCDGCCKTFAEPLVTCRCMNCDHVFDVEEAVKRSIYSYRLRPDSLSRAESSLGTGVEYDAAAPSQTHWKEFSPENTLLAYLVKRVGIPVLDENMLEKRFNKLVRLADSSRKSVTLMALQLLRLEKLANQLDRPTLLRLLGKVSEVLKQSVRPEDLAIVRRRDQILLVMADTPMGMAKIVAERIRTRLLGLNEDLGCQITLASYPEDGGNAREVLEILDAGILVINDDIGQ